MSDGLLSQHAALLTASAISDAVAEARGYRSVEHKARLTELGFSSAQAGRSGRARWWRRSWTVLRFGFTYYVTQVAHYDSAFGPISTGVTLLVFLYFASVIVLLGAEVSRASVAEDEPVPVPLLETTQSVEAPAPGR